MVANNWNWWHRPPAFGLRARTDLSSRRLFVEDDEPRIGVITDDSNRPIRFEAIGLSHSELRRLRQGPADDVAFAKVFVVLASQSSLTVPKTSVPGIYSIEDSRLIFVPRQPLLPDVAYRAVFYLRDSDNVGAHSPTETNIQHEVEVPREA